MSRMWRMAGLIVALAAVMAVSRAGTARASVPPGGTDVQIRVVYMLYSDTLNPNLTITDQVSGSCFAGSLADPGRGDAYRCSSGNRIYDPCFLAAADLSQVACVPSPWSNDAVLLTLTEDLPGRGPNRQDLLESMPWGLELADGSRCGVASTGAGGVIAGERINYSCRTADGTPGAQVVGEIDRTQGTWRVFVTGTDPWVIGQMDVAAAWY